jgi:hypothetical protein
MMWGKLACGQGASPTDSTKWRPYQIGFATSMFVKLLEEEEVSDQYQVYGRYKVDSLWALRAAVRYEQFLGDEHEVRVGGRFGIDRHFLRDGPLRLYGGADLVTAYDQFLNGDQRYQIGLAPFLGLLFHITPNISLSTEPRLSMRYAYSQNRGPESDAESLSIEVKGIGLLILSVHF